MHVTEIHDLLPSVVNGGLAVNCIPEFFTAGDPPDTSLEAFLLLLNGMLATGVE